MKRISLLLPLALGACSYEYIIEPDDESSTTGTTTATTGTTTTTTTGTAPGSGGSGAGDDGGGGSSTVTTASGDGGAGGAGGEGGGDEGGGGAGGGPVECLIVDDCPQPAGECQIATCEADDDGRLVCGIADRPDGTPVGPQEAGDCVHRACVGGVATEGVPTDDPQPDTDCATYSCDGGQNVMTPLAVNTPCGDGTLECDGAGSCVGCTDATDCPAPAACRVAVCGGGGVCSDAAAPDGAYDGLAANDCKARVCSGGVLTTVADPADLPSPDANVCTTAACSGTEPVQTPLNQNYDGNGANDCKRRDCVNGVLTTVADTSDVPASDGLPCTIEQCSGQTPVHTPQNPGTTAVGCNGVCQTGSYAGQCGLSLYSRPFPAGGSWTRQALSAAWTGANAPPPTSTILVAEETSSGSHLMVIRSDGTYYEFKNGAWQVPRPATQVFANLLSTQVSAMVSGSFLGNEIITFLTSESTPRSFSYTMGGGVEPITYSSGPDLIPNEQLTKANAPPQHNTTMTWAIGEQRGVYPNTEDAHVTWKSLQSIVYQNWSGSDPGFYYPVAPVGEATSPFGLNGASNAPAAGTIAAAFYRNATNTVYFIAP